jgi:hypothetical protein
MEEGTDFIISAIRRILKINSHDYFENTLIPLYTLSVTYTNTPKSSTPDEKEWTVSTGSPSHQNQSMNPEVAELSLCNAEKNCGLLFVLEDNEAVVHLFTSKILE